MAYTAALPNSHPLPLHPTVLGPVRLTRAASETNVGIYVPWERCRLTYAYAVTTTVVASADFEIDIELDAAGGTEIMTGTVPTSSSAVGDITEFTFTTTSAARNLGRHDTSRDMVVCELNGNAGAGAVDLYMYFEPDNG